MLEQIISISVILLISYIINLIIDKFINKVMKRKNNKNLKTILIFINKLKTVIIFGIGITLCLSKFKMFKSLSVTLLSAVGILTTILGLAAQEALKNLFGSISLLFSHPIEVGDRVHILEKDISGTVLEVSMRHTIIKGYNNQRYIIPNSVLNTLTIENYDYEDSKYCTFCAYGVSYSSDLDKAILLAKEELKKLYKDEKYDINVKVIKWDTSSVIIRCYVWGKDLSESFDNSCKLNENLKKTFEANNIEIPYNYLNVIQKK